MINVSLITINNLCSFSYIGKRFVAYIYDHKHHAMNQDRRYYHPANCILKGLVMFSFCQLPGGSFLNITT